MKKALKFLGAMVIIYGTVVSLIVFLADPTIFTGLILLAGGIFSLFAARWI